MDLSEFAKERGSNLVPNCGLSVSQFMQAMAICKENQSDMIAVTDDLRPLFEEAYKQMDHALLAYQYKLWPLRFWSKTKAPLKKQIRQLYSTYGTLKRVFDKWEENLKDERLSEINYMGKCNIAEDRPVQLTREAAMIMWFWDDVDQEYHYLDSMVDLLDEMIFKLKDIRKALGDTLLASEEQQGITSDQPTQPRRCQDGGDQRGLSE